MNTTLITQHNIFNPHDRMVLPTYATHSSQVLEELLIADGFEVELYKNSELQLEPFDIKQGDIINVVFIPMGGGGGGKQILSLVAMISLAVLAPQAAALMTGYTGTATMGAMFSAGAYGTFALSAGLMVGGSLLINAVLSPSTPSLSINDNLSTSTTYSWDESYNKFQQGLSVPKVFGTHKITPPLISKYIETIDNKQYFNGLYAVNDGEILSISDIKINDESIDNFTDVTYETRNGTLTQTTILNFDNTRSDKGVSRKLTTDYVTTETNGNSVVSLTATLLFPRGLYYALDDGTIGNNSVDVIIEYSSDEITWYPLGYVGSSTVISGSETSTLRKTFKADLAENKYYLRTKFASTPSSGSRYGSDCYLEYITEEIGDDFIYPSTALIAIRALATDQLSGNAPTISCIVSANSSNPSLIAQQMLTESGIDTARILSSFNEWETHCNTKGYAFNGVFDTSITLRKALDLVGTAGRGTVLQFGSKFDVIMDRAEEIPVQSFTFGMGNILKDSFSQSFLPILDRANVIEATYYDADNDYEPTIIEVSNNNYDSVAEENRTSITLVGFTSRTQAIKHCNYLLNCNRYLTETVSLEADKDSLVCKYGSIVSVSHDVPQYGFSGRIEACTTTTVTLDRDVTLESGKSYYIQLRDKENNTNYHYVNNSLSTTDTLTFTTPLTTAYDKYDNYAFGEVGKANKLFRVLRINTAQDMTRKLELLEYNEDVYNDEGDIVVPEISSFGISNLRATDYIRYAKDGSIETVMQLAWSGASISYAVSYKKSTDNAYTSVKSYDNKIDLIVDDVAYEIIVTDTQGMSASLLYSVQGKTIPPEDVTNLVCTESGNIFTLTWDYIPPVDFKEFVIYLASVEIGRTSSKTFSYKSLGLDTKTFTVKAIDTTNNLSSGVSVAKTASAPSLVNGLSVSYGLQGINLSWNKSLEYDFSFYEVRGADSGWGTVGTLYKGTDTACIITPTTNKTYYIKQCDIGGNYSAVSSIAVTLPTPSTPSNITHSFSDTTSSMAEVTLNWNDSISNFGISYYKVAYGTKNITIKASEIKVTADWDGDRVFSITAYDSFGFASTTAQKKITKALPNPPLNFRFQVIDNNVLFYWDEPTITTLPITSYELRRGADWASAELIGKKSGGFTTVFESVGGNFTYWIASIDSDNRYSTPTSVTATVSQPPDFILNVSNTSTFNGTKNNMLLENGYLIANIDTAKTWATHFTSNSWTTIQNQIDAGYPIFIQPTLISGYYEETVDLGTTLASSRISVTVSGQTLAGIVTTSCDISISNDGTNWTTFTNMFQVFATNFRYYKFKINVSATTATGLYKITNITSVLDSKLKNDGGSTILSLGGAHAQGSILGDYLSEWVAGMSERPISFTKGKFGGEWLTENKIIKSIAPSGELENVWVCMDYDTSTGTDGGFHCIADIDNTKGYLHAVFIKTADENSSTYVGSSKAETFNLSGTLNTNPYFWSGDLPTNNDWYLIIGYMHPHTYGTTALGISGVYDLSGVKQVGGVEYKFSPTATKLEFRVFQYSATLGDGRELTYFARPIVIECKKEDITSKIEYILTCATQYGASAELNIPFVDITSITVTSNSTTPVTSIYDFVDTPYPKRFNIFNFNQVGTKINGTASWSVKGY